MHPPTQGARNAGFFYNAHHSLRLENGGSWKALRFSSENSPFTTVAWLLAWIFESGGRDSAKYKIRCHGLFATEASDVLLARDDLEKAFRSLVTMNPTAWWC